MDLLLSIQRELQKFLVTWKNEFTHFVFLLELFVPHLKLILEHHLDKAFKGIVEVVVFDFVISRNFQVAYELAHMSLQKAMTICIVFEIWL